MTDERVVLEVSGWSSRCGACRRGASPEEKAHDTIREYGPDNGKPGCGAVFTHITSEYTGIALRLKEMRPDLELI